jgi:uncharacterized membrane protein YqhA
MLVRVFDKLRYSVIVAVISSFVAAFLMLYVGVKKVYMAVAGYFNFGNEISLASKSTGQITPLNPEDLVIVRIIESLDSFLIALVLLYFGYGIYSLFLMAEDEKERRGVPQWIIPHDLGHLKETLTHVIIVILFVLFTRVIWQRLDNLTWELLILPASIALLALGIKLAELTGKKHKENNK